MSAVFTSSRMKARTSYTFEQVFLLAVKENYSHRTVRPVKVSSSSTM